MMQRYTAAKLHTNTFQTSVAGLSLWDVFVCVCLSRPRGNVVPLSLSRSLALSFDMNLKGEDRVNT